VRHPFVELFLARMREFWREPEIVFWVFGFPILLAIGLGIAFRNKPPDRIAVGVLAGPGADAVKSALTSEAGFDTKEVGPDEGAQDLRLGKVSIVVVPEQTVRVDPDEVGAQDGKETPLLAPSYVYRFDPTRPDSVLARHLVHDALERAAGRVDPVPAKDELITKPGARYIDFLIPGLLGMNIMSGGMWGVGFVLVEMRSRKLLKRLNASPMKRSHFLGALMSGRMVMVFGEMFLLLFFGWLVFDMVLQGQLWLVTLLCVLGAAVFAGMGLMVASRAKKIETVQGLMNLVMLPMFVFSGVFFSSDRFPEIAQPFVKALPLTALNDALRAVILEGADIASQMGRIGVLLAWGVVSFVLALRLFRWT
jgi:ABC-2 type transport system permease protein